MKVCHTIIALLLYSIIILKITYDKKNYKFYCDWKFYKLLMPGIDPSDIRVRYLPPASRDSGVQLPPISGPTRRRSKELTVAPQEAKPAKLPSYSRAYRGVPLAAGIPIFEVLKRLEIEKILNRDERLILHQMLQEPTNQEAMLSELQKLEIGSRQKEALRRIRMMIKRFRQTKEDPVDNNTGSQINDKASEVMSRGVEDVSYGPKAAIRQVVGNAPIYSEVMNGVLRKCHDRLRDFIAQYGEEQAAKTQFAIIVGSGSYNPATRMHIRNFFIAKQCIESQSDNFVLGSLLSPAHPHLVRQRFRSFIKEILPAPHRLAIAQLCVKNSMWVNVDPWEITRRRVMDYLSLLEHVQLMVNAEFSSYNVKIMYLCKANVIPNISAKAMRQNNYGAVCVCRATEYDQAALSMRNEWRGVLWLAEDTAILDASMETVSSRKVREAIKKNSPLEHLVGGVIAEYFRVNRIPQKVSLFGSLYMIIWISLNHFGVL
jgi:nicotinic acid mononucleotide adenylyltransferase